MNVGHAGACSRARHARRTCLACAVCPGSPRRQRAPTTVGPALRARPRPPGVTRRLPPAPLRWHVAQADHRRDASASPHPLVQHRRAVGPVLAIRNADDNRWPVRVPARQHASEHGEQHGHDPARPRPGREATPCERTDRAGHANRGRGPRGRPGVVRALVRRAGVQRRRPIAHAHRPLQPTAKPVLREPGIDAPVRGIGPARPEHARLPCRRGREGHDLALQPGRTAGGQVDQSARGFEQSSRAKGAERCRADGPCHDACDEQGAGQRASTPKAAEISRSRRCGMRNLRTARHQGTAGSRIGG